MSTGKEFSLIFDQEAKKKCWISPEICVGLMAEFIEPEHKLLDMGIGTGLSSIWFDKFGVDVYGIDSTSSFLDVCRSKGFAKELKHGDLTQNLPYEDATFHHAICIGVLTFFADLDGLFQEVARVLKQGGIFTFDVFPQQSEDDASYTWPDRPDKKFYRHKDTHVQNVLKEHGLVEKKSLEYHSLKPNEKYNFVKMYTVTKGVES